MIEKFNINPMEKSIYPKELPFKQFERIGLDKEAVLNLPKTDLKKLLSGNKTDIVTLKIDQKGIPIKLDAKLSLSRNNDDTISLNVHPYRKEIDNKFKLDNPQLDKLKQGEIIEINSKAKNGEMKVHLVQLDKSINELVSVVKDKLKLPEKINDIKLSPEQKEQIASGKEVTIKGGNKELKVQLNLNDPSGIKIDNPLGIEKGSNVDRSNNEMKR